MTGIISQAIHHPAERIPTWMAEFIILCHYESVRNRRLYSGTENILDQLTPVDNQH